MKSVELAIKAGRARQSPLTGFVHHSYENIERASDTIPVYENFCFALALFRTKSVENILEAKTLLERLFAFQTSEGFPIYLHEFPLVTSVKSRRLEQKLSIVAQFFLRDFSSVLGDFLRSKLESLIRPIDKTEDPADFLIQSQLTGDDIEPALRLWDPIALCFTGPQKQEKGEPAVTLYDLILGEWGGKMPARALPDHPAHLLAALIYPREVSVTQPSQSWTRRFWGTGAPTHSALLNAAGMISEEGDILYIDLPEKEVHDEVEVCYFMNRWPGAALTSTTFQLDEPICIESGGLKFEMIFSLIEGEGRFWGHLHLGNRPGQIGCKAALKHEAFDRTIALRTIERTKPARIKIAFRLLSN
ncbi:MAG: hypothetical protein KBA81_03345 [Rhabdochlamydiaceae bacterium]|nr:hypothetical protein [Rhabdochlamydiaceae bacterium]